MKIRTNLILLHIALILPAVLAFLSYAQTVKIEGFFVEGSLA
jgi:hypothetical protein